MIKFTGRPKLTDTIAAVVRADDLILDLIDKNRAVRETCQSLKSHQFFSKNEKTSNFKFQWHLLMSDYIV